MRKLEGGFRYRLATRKFAGCSTFIVFIIMIFAIIFSNINQELLFLILISGVLVMNVISAVLGVFNLKLKVISNDLNISMKGKFFDEDINYPYSFEGRMITVSRMNEGVYFRLVVTDSQNKRFYFFERMRQGQTIDGVQVDTLIRQNDSKMIINTKPYPDFVWNLYNELKKKEGLKTERVVPETSEKSFVFENPFVEEEG